MRLGSDSLNALGRLFHYLLLLIAFLYQLLPKLGALEQRERFTGRQGLLHLHRTTHGLVQASSVSTEARGLFERAENMLDKAIFALLTDLVTTLTLSCDGSTIGLKRD